jgi:hypothetical protein
VNYKFAGKDFFATILLLAGCKGIYQRAERERERERRWKEKETNNTTEIETCNMIDALS